MRWLFKAVADGGGLLGDEPGLGKTVQIITVLEALIRTRLARRVLIIAPANLISNWKAVRPPPLALSPSLPSLRDVSGPASLCSLRLIAGAHGRQASHLLPLSSMLSPSSDAQEFGKWLGGTPHELTVTALKPSASNLSLALQLQQLVQISCARCCFALLCLLRSVLT